MQPIISVKMKHYKFLKQQQTASGNKNLQMVFVPRTCLCLVL